MQTMILAAGSLLILFLIILALPLGFTMKGKTLISLASFILALCGIAAVTVVPFWQAGLMLSALVFISAYFIDKKFNGMVYQKAVSFEEEDEEEPEFAPSIKNELPAYEEPDLLIPVGNSILAKEAGELPDLKITAASVTDVLEEEIGVLDDQEDVLVANSIPKEELVPDSVSLSEIESLLAKEIIESTGPTTDSLAEVAVSVEEEDISFLLERETEQIDDNEPEILTEETGYLSDIESLLELESVESAKYVDDAEGDQDDVLLDIKEDNNPIDESLFDFLNRSKEDTADLEDTLEIIDDRKKIANM